MRIIAIVLFFCAMPFAGLGQQKPLSKTDVSTCDSPASSVVDEWVKSGSGSAAAVELRSEVTGDGKQRRCHTSWILHFRKKDGHARAITVADREDGPGDNEWTQENWFEIDGWSRDRRLLLTSQIEAQGDWDETTPILFDFDSNHSWRVELYPLFKKMIPAEC